MNKKEFEEKFTVEYSAHYKEHKRKYIITSTLSDELWQWIEQQIKDARIDENQKHIDYLIERNREGNFIILQGYFENRIKELSK